MAQTTVKADAVGSAGAPRPATATRQPPFAPSPATTATGERLASTDFAAPEACIACHSDIAAGWQASGHAVATTAPLYRAWFKAADQDTQGAIGPYCAGCHTPIGLLSGQIRSRWAWRAVSFTRWTIVRVPASHATCAMRSQRRQGKGTGPT